MKKFSIFISAFLLIFILYNFKVVRIQGNSMYPTLQNNSFALVDKHLHKFFLIQKNEIFLLLVGEKEVVKKIVAFPGETIEFNGKKVNLLQNEVYVLGENLPESIDSREYGPIKTSKIIGKVVLNF